MAKKPSDANKKQQQPDTKQISARLDKTLVRQAHIRCVEEDLSLTEVVTDLLTQWLQNKIRLSTRK